MLDTILLNREERLDKRQMLIDLPENESIFKCNQCRTIFNIYNIGLPIFMSLIPKNDVRCPNCGINGAELMCRADVYSIYLKMKGYKCRDSSVISGTDMCPVCSSPICPRCFNHTVISLSRVTGYMSDISGWNNAKRQELSDRKRYDFGNR